MVLGFLLYEAVDLAWNFGGMTYRGGKYIYNWYYQVPSQDDIEIKELEEIKKRMAVLEDLLRSQQSKKLDDK
tara:strand:- start:717 stop:932 length:216 start_codon:yes stop_codon:yes gene_type:complete